MTTDPNCIFCKIVAGEIPSFKVYKDDDALAFMDINPVNDGHVLIIPKAHSEDIFAVSDAAIAATTMAAKRVAKAVQAALEPAGMNLFQCNGEAANQSVPHFHVHVIPRRMGDALAMNWELQAGDMAAIGQIAERIRAHL